MKKKSYANIGELEDELKYFGLLNLGFLICFLVNAVWWLLLIFGCFVTFHWDASDAAFGMAGFGGHGLLFLAVVASFIIMDEVCKRLIKKIREEPQE